MSSTWAEADGEIIGTASLNRKAAVPASGGSSASA